MDIFGLSKKKTSGAVKQKSPNVRFGSNVYIYDGSDTVELNSQTTPQAKFFLFVNVWIY